MLGNSLEFLFNLMVMLESLWLLFCVKAHEGGVIAVELSRVIGGAPQLITIGADKTLAIWDTISFKVMDLISYFCYILHSRKFLDCSLPSFGQLNPFQEMRRIKPVSKLACHSVASWCHPRAPNLDILTCVKDSHIWYAFSLSCLSMTL